MAVGRWLYREAAVRLRRRWHAVRVLGVSTRLVVPAGRHALGASIPIVAPVLSVLPSFSYMRMLGGKKSTERIGGREKMGGNINRILWLIKGDRFRLHQRGF